MGKVIIGALVAGLLLMIWQTLSHTALNLHAVQEQYTPNQEAIMEVLSKNLDKEGQYYMPNVPPGSSMEEMTKVMDDNLGKPYATVLYHPVNDTNMGMNIIQGLLTNIILAFVLVWIIGQFKNLTFSKVLAASIAVGFIGFCFHPYPGFIWYKTPGIWIELLDSIVAFGLAGIWLGWWMTRKKV